MAILWIPFGAYMITITINFTPLEGKTIPVRVAHKDRILVVKQKIERACGLHPSRYVLTYKGKVLADQQNLHDYGIADGGTVVAAPPPTEDDD